MEKVVVITGASGGIGAATARELAARGMRVALVARRADLLAETARECGVGAVAIPADVTRREEVRQVVNEAARRLGTISVWINNVGQGITRLPSELNDEDVAVMMQVNVMSALYGMQEVLPHFLGRGGGRGHLINISSMLGRIPSVAYRSAYSAAKHFLNAITIMFRAELESRAPGIGVSLVSPPAVATEFGRNARHGGPDSRSLANPQDPAEVARVIARVVEAGASDVYTVPGARRRVAQYYAALGEDPG